MASLEDVRSSLINVAASRAEQAATYAADARVAPISNDVDGNIRAVRAALDAVAVLDALRDND